MTDARVSQALNLLKQGGTDVKMGNLLTLPVGGGLLYVQPVYVAASAGTTYPLMQYVLTSFGDGNPIGFAPTLEESLNMTFGGDSGAQAGDADVSGSKPDVVEDPGAMTEDPGATPTEEPTAEPTDTPTEEPAAEVPAGDLTPQQRLDQALANAGKAIQDGDTAMSSGDWAAYGAAQDALKAALDEAIAARAEIDGNG